MFSEVSEKEMTGESWNCVCLHPLHDCCDWDCGLVLDWKIYWKFSVP